MGLDARKPVFGGFRTTNAQISLCIRSVVIRLLEIIISRLAISGISIIQLVYVVGETVLNVALTKTGPIILTCYCTCIISIL